MRRGVLLRRYKRFFAELRLDDGAEILAHCPNPGAMSTCATPGWVGWVSHDPNPKRKLAWTLELMVDDTGCRILVNTMRPNALVLEALKADRVAALQGYSSLRTEVHHGEGRVDFMLHGEGRPDCLVEVKNVTMLVSIGVAAFPDSVTARGARHMRELAEAARQGRRAVVLFVVGREGVTRVLPADELDPAYGLALREAVAAGVEVMALGLRFEGGDLRVGEPVEVLIAPAPPAPSGRRRGSGPA